MSTIKGMWSTAKLICGNHDCHGDEKSIEMVIHEGPHSLFYACPKYHPENRTEKDRPCFNRINLVDFEKMLNHIADLIIDADCTGEIFDLNHYIWESKGIDYKVIKYNNDELVVEMLNRKSLAK